jgi:hypothetical protein
MRLNSPSEAFNVKGQWVSSTTNMLAAGGVEFTECSSGEIKVRVWNSNL